MQYAYGILCHQMTNPLRFLVSCLHQNSESVIFIHVDQKADIEPFITEFSTYPRVHFIKDRMNVLWGHFSQVEATLKLLQLAGNYDYQYFSLLSGDDIPLQSISKFHEFLQQNPYEYIDLDKFPSCKPEPRVKYKHGIAFFKKHKTRTEYLSCKWQKKLFKILINNNDISELPKLYKGSQWFTLSHSAIDHIFQYLENNPKYIDIFKTSLCGDELFFHTILFNSEFVNRIKTKNTMSESYTRYIDWHTGPDFPRTLDESDFDKLKSSGMFFSRKLQQILDISILKAHFCKG